MKGGGPFRPPIRSIWGLLVVGTPVMAAGQFLVGECCSFHDAAKGATVGATTFDRLFAGAQFDAVDGDLLYVFAKDEETAAEIEDRFAFTSR